MASLPSTYRAVFTTVSGSGNRFLLLVAAACGLVRELSRQQSYERDIDSCRRGALVG